MEIEKNVYALDYYRKPLPLGPGSYSYFIRFYKPRLERIRDAF